MHSINAAYCYRCLNVLWSVCVSAVCLLVTTVIRAKTDERLRRHLSLRCGLEWAQETVH